jgi:hypothetical protein
MEARKWMQTGAGRDESGSVVISRKFRLSTLSLRGEYPCR